MVCYLSHFLPSSTRIINPIYTSIITSYYLVDYLRLYNLRLANEPPGGSAGSEILPRPKRNAGAKTIEGRM